MTTINGIVTIGDTEVPGQADVLLLNAAGTDVVASTKSDAVTGAYAFEGLPGGTVFRVLVLGGGVYRSRAFGPVVTEADTGGDPYWENVVSLLRFDELAGDAVLDEKGFSWNFAGAVRLDTAVKRFGQLRTGGGLLMPLITLIWRRRNLTRSLSAVTSPPKSLRDLTPGGGTRCSPPIL